MGFGGIYQRWGDSVNKILDHWKTPFHNWEPPQSDCHGRAVSVACGDEVDLFLIVKGGVIEDAYFVGHGCTICLGMTSLLTQHLLGITVEKAQQMSESEVLDLAEMEIDRRRHDCALVALKALKRALL